MEVPTERILDALRRVAGEEIGRLLLDLAMREAALEVALGQKEETEADADDQ